MKLNTHSSLLSLARIPASRSLERGFASSGRVHAASQGESSSGQSQYGRNPGESAEDAFRRNIRDVQTFRRRRDALRIKTPFIPPQSRDVVSTQPGPTKAALSTLLATGAALGSSSSKLDPAFAQFVYANRSGLSIIDLDQTLPILRRTVALVRDVVKSDGVVLFVATKANLQRSLDKAKERMGDNGFTTTRWMPGLLTNAETLFGLQPLVDKSYLPDLVVFLNPAENVHAVRECTMRNIPTVGVVDSDTDPRVVTYPIPANAQSVRTSELILGALSLAGQEGRRLRLKETQPSRSRR